MHLITGDTHGDFRRIGQFCYMTETTKEAILVILGDAGINYYNQGRDQMLKKEISNLPITLFCIHGNHEIRPQNIPTYHSIDWNGGKALIEDAYPNIIFVIDGEIYQIAGKKCIVIGGAYSVDIYYRIVRGWGGGQMNSRQQKPNNMLKSSYLKTKIKLILFFHIHVRLNMNPLKCFYPLSIKTKWIKQQSNGWIQLNSVLVMTSGFVVIIIQKKQSVNWNSYIKVF